MSFLEEYVRTFNPRVAILVPDALSAAVEKISDDRYILSMIVKRKRNLQPHRIFFSVENNRYTAKLNEETIDLGVVFVALCMRIMSIYNAYPGSEIYLHDTFEKTESRIGISAE